MRVITPYNTISEIEADMRTICDIRETCPQEHKQDLDNSAR